MFKRVLASLVGAGLVLSLFAGSAAAIRLPDQEQADTSGISIAFGVAIGQTFTPAHSGYLDTVSFYARAYTDGTSNNQSVSVQALTGGMPNGSALATKNVVVADGWNNVVFDTPAPIKAGVTYALVVNPAESLSPNYTCAAGNYTRGQALIQDGTWKTIPQYVSDHSLNAAVYCVTDFAFRAYVIADNLDLQMNVTPTTATPGGTGAMTLTISVTNNGTLPTSNNVVLDDVAHAIPFNPTTTGCSPAVCIEGMQLDMGVIAAGATVTWTGTGTFNATGVPSGTTLTDGVEACVTDTIAQVNLGNVRSNATGTLQSNGCWLVTVDLVVGNAATPAPTLHVTLPPTTSAPNGGNGSSGTPLAFVLLSMALSGTMLLALAGARRR